MQIDLVKPLRHKIQLVGFQHIYGCLGHFLHPHKPLRLNQRFHCSMAAVMSSHRVRMRLHPHQQALGFQIGHDGFPCLIAVHARIFSALFVDGGIIVHDVDFFQIMPFSHLEVVGVVSRRNLHAAGSEFPVHVLVGDHRDFPVRQRQLQHLADQILIPFILRIDSHRRIAQHGFRTRRGDLHVPPLFSHNRIIDVPEKAVLIHVLHLGIGKRRLAPGAPVNDTAALVDPALLIQTDKHFLHGF